MTVDARHMARAVELAWRASGTTAPNPAVGCVLAHGERVVGEGATAPGGRPHAEAAALEAARGRADGATAYVTLEPCAHGSARGPACAGLLAASGVARVVVALRDPDPRTSGRGVALLRAAGLEVAEGEGADAATAPVAGWLHRLARGRPRVTLKLAMSIDGRIATASGESRWITGEAARQHAHLLRARSDLIIVGRGTLEADDPELTVRLPGFDHRRPAVAILSRSLDKVPDRFVLGRRDAAILRDPDEIDTLPVNDILVEGGASAAAAFLRSDRVDRLFVYRAPILIGDGRAGVGDLALADLAAAHGRWRRIATETLGDDLLETYAAAGQSVAHPLQIAAHRATAA